MAFLGAGDYLWHPAAISTISQKYPSKRGFAMRFTPSTLTSVRVSRSSSSGGILAPFYFLAGTVLLANLVVLAIRERQPEAPALVEELA